MTRFPVRITVTLTEDDGEWVKGEAATESRDACQMVRVLVQEARRARERAREE